MAAVTGVFQADFKSFYDAVAQSTVKLKDFQSSAEGVAAKVDKIGNAFSGRKAVQEAELMTKAINEIGGATALTAKEQAQVNAKLAEAIEKYKVLGQTAPKEMKDLEAATRAVNKETKETSTGFDKIKGGLMGLAGAVGIAFSVDAIAGFVGKVFDSASQIKDLSDKLGVSTQAVQKFKYAAEQSGATIDDVGAAIFKMNQKLAEGDKGTVAALKDVGLTLDQMRSMSPEDAFLTLADAIGKIENPAVRARLEVELLGKAGGALGAAIAGGFREVADSATTMSDDTIQALEAAQQAWENLYNAVVIYTGNMIGETSKAISSMTSSWKAFAIFAGNAMTMGIGAAMTVQSGIQTGMNRKPLTDAERAEIETQGGFGTPIVAGSAEQERINKEREAAARKAEAAADKQKAADEKIFAGMRQFGEKLAKLEAQNARNFAAVGQGIQRFIQINRAASEDIPDITRGWKDIGVGAVEAGKKLEMAGATFGQALNKNAADANAFFRNLERLPTVAGEFGKLGGAVSNLGDIFGSKLLSQIGATTTAFSKVSGSIGEMKGGFDKMTSGGGLTSVLGGFSSIVSGIGGIISAVQMGIQLGKQLYQVFANNEGRKSVEEYAKSYGGFDVLQKKLELLGDEGARLWVKLTQGTDKGNAALAQRNIAEVEAALEEYDRQQKENTQTTEEQARATVETASEAKKAIEELAPMLQGNKDAWKAWGDDVTGHIDRVAEALRGLSMPNLSGGAINASQATPATGGGTAVINIDGRQVAEAVVPHVPGVVRRYGLA